MYNVINQYQMNTNTIKYALFNFMLNKQHRKTVNY